MCRPDYAIKMCVFTTGVTTGVVQIALGRNMETACSQVCCTHNDKDKTHSSQACQVVHAPCKPNSQHATLISLLVLCLCTTSPTSLHAPQEAASAMKDTHSHTRAAPHGATAADTSDSTRKRTPIRLSNLHMHNTAGRAHPADLHQPRAGPPLCTQTYTPCPHATTRKQDRHKGHRLAAMHVTGAPPKGHVAQAVAVVQQPHNAAHTRCSDPTIPHRVTMCAQLKKQTCTTAHASVQPARAQQQHTTSACLGTYR